MCHTPIGYIYEQVHVHRLLVDSLVGLVNEGVRIILLYHFYDVILSTRRGTFVNEVVLLLE